MILGNFKDLIKSPSGNRAMLITAVCFAMGLGIIWSPLADQINVKLIKTLEFRFRALAGMNPTLDPRIKVFAFDDRTAAKAQYPDLSIRDWSMLAAEVAKFKPKGIFFDKVFGLPMNQRQIPAAVETVNSAINRVDTRLVHGIFVSNTKIRSHNTHIQEAHGDFNQSFPIKLQNTSHIKWIQPTYQHVYGAHPKLRPFLRNPGHNN